MRASRSEGTLSQASTPHAQRHRSRGSTGGSELDVRSMLSESSRGLRSSRRSAGSLGSRQSKAPPMTLQDMQRHVQEEAMNRYVQGLQHEAKAAKQEQETWGTTIRGAIDDEKNEVRSRRQKARTNQDDVLRQIEGNKASKVEQRKEYIEAASLHSFPLFTETYISEAEVEQVRKNQREQWREELNQQLVTSKMLRNLEERKHHELAKRNIKDSVKTTIKERGIERDRLVRQGRELVEAWDRDVRLKSIKEAIRCGKDMASPSGSRASQTPLSHGGWA